MDKAKNNLNTEDNAKGSKKQGKESGEKAKKEEEYSIAAYKWGKMVVRNSKLVHLDISFNGFKAADI